MSDVAFAYSSDINIFSHVITFDPLRSYHNTSHNSDLLDLNIRDNIRLKLLQDPVTMNVRHDY